MGNRAADIVISENAHVVATSDQINCDLDGEMVILSLKGGVYFGLNPVGTRIWQLVQMPRTIGEIRNTLLEEYDVDRDRCTRELLALVQQLAANGLVEILDATAS